MDVARGNGIAWWGGPVSLLTSGLIVQLDYFTNTAFSVNFVVFFLFTAALVALAGFTSVFISKAKSSRMCTACAHGPAPPHVLTCSFARTPTHTK